MVNIYKRTDFWNQTNPTPEKVVYNLTTSVSSIKFNPTSEILAMASEVKENAVKLLHLPSMTVFSNFPSYNYNFKRPNCIDFSLNGGFFSIGNNRGAANLFRYVVLPSLHYFRFKDLNNKTVDENLRLGLKNDH